MEEILIQDYQEEGQTLQQDQEEEQTPKQGQEEQQEQQEDNVLQEAVSVSENAVSENNLNEQILEEIRGLREDVQNFERVPVPISVSVDVLSGNAISDLETISRNIIDTPINDYTLSESIGLMILGALFVGALVWIIRRSVFKWK